MLAQAKNSVSVGEMLLLENYVYKYGMSEQCEYTCSCGKQVTDCDFWGTVLKEKINGRKVRTNIKKIGLKEFFLRYAFLGRGNVFRLLVKKNRDIIKSLDQLYDEIMSVADVGIVIDSSKDVEMLVLSQLLVKQEMYFVYIERNLLDVVKSKLKWGKKLRNENNIAFNVWVGSWLLRLKNRIMIQVFENNNIYKIKYEDLLKKKYDAIREIYSKAGVKTNVSEESIMDLTWTHNIAGTPNKNTGLISMK